MLLILPGGKKTSPIFFFMGQKACVYQKAGN